MALQDAHGRLLSALRVSVTDRCNFRCRYCMPAEGMPWIDRAEILSFEEIERLVRLFVALGVEDVRLTGGEPLVRRGVPARGRQRGGARPARARSRSPHSHPRPRADRAPGGAGCAPPHRAL